VHVPVSENTSPRHPDSLHDPGEDLTRTRLSVDVLGVWHLSSEEIARITARGGSEIGSDGEI
jgi:hypothetical protein